MKKKKNKIELKEDERLETPWEVFTRNYKNVPGFKMVLKLGVYFLFILFMLIVVLANGRNKNTTDTVSTDEVTTTMATTSNSVVVKYRDILDSIITNKVNVDADITIDEVNYNITYEYDNGNIGGYLATVDSNKHFKVMNNVIYEIVLKEEVENPELFGSINLNYLINGNLVALLEDNVANKTINNNLTIYKYVIDNVTYLVNINNETNLIENIEITGDNFTYNLKYSIEE